MVLEMTAMVQDDTIESIDHGTAQSLADEARHASRNRATAR